MYKIQKDPEVENNIKIFDEIIEKIEQKRDIIENNKENNNIYNFIEISKENEGKLEKNYENLSDSDNEISNKNIKNPNEFINLYEKKIESLIPKKQVQNFENIAGIGKNEYKICKMFNKNKSPFITCNPIKSRNFISPESKIKEIEENLNANKNTKFLICTEDFEIKQQIVNIFILYELGNIDFISKNNKICIINPNIEKLKKWISNLSVFFNEEKFEIFSKSSEIVDKKFIISTPRNFMKMLENNKEFCEFIDLFIFDDMQYIGENNSFDYEKIIFNPKIINSNAKICLFSHQIANSENISKYILKNFGENTYIFENSKQTEFRFYEKFENLFELLLQNIEYNKKQVILYSATNFDAENLAISFEKFIEEIIKSEEKCKKYASFCEKRKFNETIEKSNIDERYMKLLEKRISLYFSEMNNSEKFCNLNEFLQKNSLILVTEISSFYEISEKINSDYLIFIKNLDYQDLGKKHKIPETLLHEITYKKMQCFIENSQREFSENFITFCGAKLLKIPENKIPDLLNYFISYKFIDDSKTLSDFIKSTYFFSDNPSEIEKLKAKNIDELWAYDLLENNHENPIKITILGKISAKYKIPYKKACFIYENLQNDTNFIKIFIISIKVFFQ